MDKVGGLCYFLSINEVSACSSAGQSNGLLIRRSQVRILPGVPVKSNSYESQVYGKEIIRIIKISQETMHLKPSMFECEARSTLKRLNRRMSLVDIKLPPLAI